MNTSTPTSAPKRLMLDEKDFFDVLRAQRPSPPATDPQTLDGYLTALIIGPRFIDPRQWIPSFVGEGALMAPEHTTEAKA
ncbi:YecA family protein, partial [Falsigemmobacter intermedius]